MAADTSRSDATKPLALLIPGLDGTGLLYYKQLAALEARFRALPWAFRKRPQFDFTDLVEELGQGTRDEKSGSILVVGESFGGVIALHYVLAFPERVCKLVLVNTFAHYRGRIRIHLACRLAPLLSWGPVRAFKDSVAERILRGEGIAPSDRKRYREIINLIDRPSYQRRLELVRQVDLRNRLHDIAVPTRVLASGRDKIVASIKEARLLSSLIPQARLHSFPRAGHALLLTPGFSLADYV